MRDKKILILDGHHRCTASHRLSREKGKGTGTGKETYTLMMLLEGGDRALLLLPWHRCLKNCRMEDLWRRIEENFDIENYGYDKGNYPGESESKSKSKNEMEAIYSKLNEREHDNEFDVRLGMYDGGKFYLLRADEGRVRELAEKRNERVGLDLIALHEWLIKPTLIGKSEDIIFTSSPRDAIKKIDTGAYKVAFFLKPMEITNVEYKARVERKQFPQKSTLFLPKVAEGVVMRKFHEE
jgi:uncharacterized protein (DUF1015 family)